ncbi:MULTISPECIES: TerD family protein [Listeria]|uniref:TerD family protein n=1 Tax=Listeria TaxID=1637 RepID=UPI000B590AEE|nr:MULTISPECIES: TerD family protein [Listeria]
MYELTIRRQNGIYLPQIKNSEVTTKKLEQFLTKAAQLGYSVSIELIEGLSNEHLEGILAAMYEIKGVKNHKAFHKNFPKQVAEMDDLELYGKAVLHYATFGSYLPNDKEETRAALNGVYKLQEIKCVSEADMIKLTNQLIHSKEAFSGHDKADLKILLRNFGGKAQFENVTQKENLAFLIKMCLKYQLDTAALMAEMKTATDVLRFAVSLSDGDTSLAEPTRFITFKRPMRRLMLENLNETANLTEDMRRHKRAFIRLGEKLHPSEYRNVYPHAAAGFDVIRNNEKVITFNRKVECALAESNLAEAISLLKSRPGEFARRFDYLLRIFFDEAEQNQLFHAFKQVATRTSVPILLNMRSHFESRTKNQAARIFFPKGQKAKVFVTEETRVKIAMQTALRVIQICDDALVSQFAQKDYLGKVFVDEELKNYTVPFANRSTNKSLKQFARGSRIKLNFEEHPILRLFIYWKGGMVDIDSSVMLFDENYSQVSYCSYYELRDAAHTMTHSGDITSAPDGASEFIDIKLKRAQEIGAKYAAISINSFSRIPYSELEECFVGLMNRTDSESGEIFEPKTVSQKFDLTSIQMAVMPFIVDLEAQELVWCDLGLGHEEGAPNNIHTHLTGIEAITYAMTTLKKPTLYDLFCLHGKARGELVLNREEADVIFGAGGNVEASDFEKIMGEFI